MNIAITDTRKARVAYDDLREWIVEADKLGELVRANGYSWQEDIGMAAELLQHDAAAPVALFDNIPGYPKGFRVLTNFFGARRQNMTLGFSPDLNKIELSEAFLTDFQKISDKPLPYQVVETGPVMENVIEGDAVDVTRFPTPVWHDRDEGRRYIGTGSFNVTRDPDDGWVNAGTYRVMIHDAKRLGFYISPGKHGRIHRDKYQALNKPMPVCIVIGGDPLTFLMACTEVPYGICEYEIAGAYRGRPQKVVLGKHTGLPYPANAEIVIEGFVQPGNNMPEGPFGEWTGYYGSKMRSEPVLDIKAIYHRNDPIILGCPPQRPPEEQARYRAVMRSALLKQENREIEDSPVSAQHLGELVALIAQGKINGKIAKDIFPKMAVADEAPEVIVKRERVESISDEGALGKIIDEVIAANPKQVEQYKGGKQQVIGFLVGQVMKASRGQADPAVVNRMFKEKL